MAAIYFQFEADHEANLESVAHEIKNRLNDLKGISEADAKVLDQRLGLAETAAIISGVILIVKEGRELITEVRKLLPEIAGLINDFKGLKKIFIEVGEQRIEVDKMTETDLEKLAE